MKKSIVIYTSKRGSTKQYAEWIAEELSRNSSSAASLCGAESAGHGEVTAAGESAEAGQREASKADDNSVCTCTAMPLSEALKNRIDLHGYDCIIYGGWIRGSGIVDFDRFAGLLEDDLMDRLLVYGTGFADETAENYAQVWGYSLGKIDPKNEHRVLLYILGGRYDPSSVTGLDKFLMKTMRAVLISGSTAEAKARADMMRDRIDNGCDLLKRENINSLVKDAKKMLQRN